MHVDLGLDCMYRKVDLCAKMTVLVLGRITHDTMLLFGFDINTLLDPSGTQSLYLCSLRGYRELSGTAVPVARLHLSP